MRFIKVLNSKTWENKAFRTTNGFKRELASGKISDFFLCSYVETPPHGTQSVETMNAYILSRWYASQLILAKIGVPSDGKNPVVHTGL